LTGTIRGRLIAHERLLAAGEYAMPQLLTHLLDRNNPTLAGEVRRVMIDLGRQAVIPLVTAMPGLPATNQETVVDTLGVIPWRTRRMTACARRAPARSSGWAARVGRTRRCCTARWPRITTTRRTR
jgi:hypothetical protein